MHPNAVSRVPNVRKMLVIRVYCALVDTQQKFLLLGLTVCNRFHRYKFRKRQIKTCLSYWVIIFMDVIPSYRTASGKTTFSVWLLWRVPIKDSAS